MNLLFKEAFQPVKKKIKVSSYKYLEGEGAIEHCTTIATILPGFDRYPPPTKGAKGEGRKQTSRDVWVELCFNMFFKKCSQT